MRSQQLYMSFKAVGDLHLGQDGVEGNFLVSSGFFLENYPLSCGRLGREQESQSDLVLWPAEGSGEM